MKDDALKKSILTLAVIALIGLGGPALAQDTGTLDKDKVVEQPKPYSPYVDQHFPQQVLFGDMHHHTSLSVDSGLIGNNNPPDVSFRLARGEVVTSNSGQPVKLVRPLDFLVVTDHAEYLGIAKLLREGDPDLLATDVGKDGKTHERVYDVACSDGRAIVNRRCEREVGNTVDVANASYTNSIGDVMLMAHWQDPDFDPKQRAFYYVRAIEILTPRWTAYDAERHGITMPKEVTMTLQERAYSSPIWYTP